MKDLDKNEVYDLRGITHEQAVELLKWLKVNDVDWEDCHLSLLTSQRYLRWEVEWNCGSADSVSSSTHISFLFEIELESLIRQRDELNKRIEEYGNPKVGDVCKVVVSGGHSIFITKVESIEYRDGAVDYVNEWGVESCVKITEQEVIELLFKK